MGVVASPSIPRDIHYSWCYSSTRLLSLSGVVLCHFCHHCTARSVDFHPHYSSTPQSTSIYICMYLYAFIYIQVNMSSIDERIHRSSSVVNLAPMSVSAVVSFVNCPAVTVDVTGRTVSIHPHSTYFHPRLIAPICPHTFIRWRVTERDGPSLVLLFAYLILIVFGRLKFLCTWNYAGY